MRLQVFWVTLVTVILLPLAQTRISEEELITITDTSAIFSWFTDQPSDGRVVYDLCESLTPFRLRTDTYSHDNLLKEDLFSFVKHGVQNTSYHYIEINSLLPGKQYCYQLRSGLFVGDSTRFSPGNFTTIVPPSGRFLFTFATLNDMHVGEKTAGLIVIGGIVLTPGFEWPDESNPYWKFSNEAAVEAINKLGVDFTVVKGDISSDYTEEEFQWAKQILDRLDRPYWPMRGNHDRVQQRPEDYYKKVFGLNQTWYSFNYNDFHFIALDSVDLQDGHPDLLPEQVEWLSRDLASSANMTTFMFLHHAVTAEAAIWSLDKEDRQILLDLLEENPQVIGVFSGHSHRAKLTTSPQVSRIWFAETPASKEYPLGFSVYRVYTNGFIQTFYRTNCPECLEWNSMTRQMFFRAAPFTQLGTPADRNYAYSF